MADKPTLFKGITQKDLDDTKLVALYAQLCKNEIHYWYNRSGANYKQSLCFLLLERTSGGREGILKRMFHYADSLRCEDEMNQLFAGKVVPIMDGFKTEGIRQREVMAKELFKRQRVRATSDRKWILANFTRTPVKHRETASA